EEVLDQVAGLPVEHLDPRPAADAGPGDDVGEPVAGPDKHTAPERGIVGEEAIENGRGSNSVGDTLAVEDLNLRPTAAAGAGNHVREADVVDIADGHIHSASATVVVGHEVGDNLSCLPIDAFV